MHRHAYVRPGPGGDEPGSESGLDHPGRLVDPHVELDERVELRERRVDLVDRDERIRRRLAGRDDQLRPDLHRARR